jgi:hypothetical protein
VTHGDIADNNSKQLKAARSFVEGSCGVCVVWLMKYSTFVTCDREIAERQGCCLPFETIPDEGRVNNSRKKVKNIVKSVVEFG